MAETKISDESKKNPPVADDKGKAPEAEPKPGEESKPSPSPVQTELEKSRQGKPKRSKKEILDFNIKRLEKQRDALPPEDAAKPADEDEEPDDDEPVTFGDLRKREIVDGTATAKKLADERVEDADERELVKTYLETRIKPSGDAEKDFRDALAIVNSVKNAQVVEELSRKGSASSAAHGSGSPAKPGEKGFEPTPEERVYMAPPFNLSEADIKDARAKASQQ